MRLVDGALAIPRLFLLLILVAVWEHMPVPALVVVLGATGWFATSRIVRGEVLRLREAEFVQAATALGAGPARIIFLHLLPNVAGPLLVAATLGVGGRDPAGGGPVLPRRRACTRRPRPGAG